MQLQISVPKVNSFYAAKFMFSHNRHFLSLPSLNLFFTNTLTAWIIPGRGSSVRSELSPVNDDDDDDDDTESNS